MKFFLKSIWITILAIIVVLVIMACIEDMIIRTEPVRHPAEMDSKLAHV